MDKKLFVQNIKKACENKGVKPAIAFRESGVDKSFISNIETRGSVPSVEKVQKLAAYLGVTTSELLGEEKEPIPVSEDGQDYNLLQIAGRDGSRVACKLTDDQVELIKKLIDQLPNAEDI